MSRLLRLNVLYVSNFLLHRKASQYKREVFFESFLIPACTIIYLAEKEEGK